MKNILLAFFFLISFQIFSQDTINQSCNFCLNNPNFVKINSSDGESKLSFCFDGSLDYVVVTQKFEFAKKTTNYRIKVRQNSPLYLVDDQKTVLKLKLSKIEYYNSDYDSDYLECQYFYPVSKFNINSLLLHPVTFIFLYRDDRVELFDLNSSDQKNLYEVAKDFYVFKKWKLKLE
jgi:hypothetical protein